MVEQGTHKPLVGGSKSALRYQARRRDGCARGWAGLAATTLLARLSRWREHAAGNSGRRAVVDKAPERAPALDVAWATDSATARSAAAMTPRRPLHGRGRRAAPRRRSATRNTDLRGRLGSQPRARPVGARAPEDDSGTRAGRRALAHCPTSPGDHRALDRETGDYAGLTRLRAVTASNPEEPGQSFPREPPPPCAGGDGQVSDEVDGGPDARCRGAGWRATELRYMGPGGALAMTLVLPDDLAAFEKRLSPSMLTGITGAIAQQRELLAAAVTCARRTTPGAEGVRPRALHAPLRHRNAGRAKAAPRGARHAPRPDPRSGGLQRHPRPRELRGDPLHQQGHPPGEHRRR